MNDQYYPSKYIVKMVNSAIKLNAKDIRQLIVDYRNGNNDALDTIYRAIYPLIYKIVWKNMRTIIHWELPFDDVFQTLLLLAKNKVIDKYDVDRKESLITLLHRWLSLAMIQIPRFMLTEFDARRLKNGGGFEKRKITNIDELSSTNGIMANDIPDRNQNDITNDILNNAIDKLDENSKLYISLVYGSGKVSQKHEQKIMNKLQMTPQDRDNVLYKLKCIFMEDQNKFNPFFQV